MNAVVPLNIFGHSAPARRLHPLLMMRKRFLIGEYLIDAEPVLVTLILFNTKRETARFIPGEINVTGQFRLNAIKLCIRHLNISLQNDF